MFGGLEKIMSNICSWFSPILNGLGTDDILKGNENKLDF